MQVYSGGCFYILLFLSLQKQQYMSVNMVSVREDEYNQLLEDQAFLDCLKAAGVDNWEGYSAACEMFDNQSNEKPEDPPSPTLEDLKNSDWYKSRPDIIKAAIDKMPPILMYQFKDSGKECYIVGYSEPENPDTEVSLTVQKTGKGGPMAEMGLGHLDTNQVFGVSMEDIEPKENAHT
jgi:hypothetical protein